MLNSVTIMVRLARDPELRRTNSGDAVTSFSIACDRDFKGKDGQRAVDWIDIVAWRQTAEFADKYLAKGRMIIVDGRLQTRKWTDRDGGTAGRRDAGCYGNYCGAPVLWRQQAGGRTERGPQGADL